MTTERDELVGLLKAERWKRFSYIDEDGNHDGGIAEQSNETLADAILAAGYSKPRTITTEEELDALPSEVVILDANNVPREGLRGIDGARNYWRSMGPARMLRSYEIPLPAMVLYEPQP